MYAHPQQYNMASSSFLLPSIATTSACPPLNKPTGTLSGTKRGRRLSCKATASTGAGDDPLELRLDRRDVLLGLTGVAATTTSNLGLPGLVLAGDGEGATKPTKCVTGKITDEVLKCKPGGGFRCPVGEYRPEDVVDFSTLPPPTGPARVRRPAHRVQGDRAYVEKYEEAIRKMKELDVTDPDNPHSFKNQAAIHEAYCDFHYNVVAAAAEGKSPPEVSFDVHFSWIFAPWHRMYIYFFERILGELVGDSAFALPYWNWDAPDGMVVPEMYRKASSPLYDAKRNADNVSAIVDLNLGPGMVMEQGLRPCDDDICQIETNLCTIYRQMSAETAEQFHGRKFCAGGVESPGNLERVAHTAVHIWVGNPADNNENMGILGKAARDPVFYAHHANVDRMWHLWTTMLGHEDHFADGNDEWLDTSFVFYDEKKRLVRMRIRDVVDTRRLGYTFEEKEKIEWLDNRPKPAADIQRPLIKMRSAKRMFPLAVKKGKKEYVTVERPEEARRAAAREVPEVLVVEVTFDPCEYAKFDVLVNVPRGQERRVGPRNSEFAGSFVNLPHGSDGGMGTLTLSYRFELQELLEDLELAKDRMLDITLVPIAGDKVAVDGVRVELLRKPS